MSRVPHTPGLVLLMVFALPGLVRAKAGPSQDRVFTDTYKILVDRNIFSRNRQPYREPSLRSRESSAPRPAPPVEAGFILRGITRQKDQATAFIEHAQGGIERYVVGDPVARGHIRSLTLDYLEYARVIAAEPNDPNAPRDANSVQVTGVRIGQTLLGQTAGAATAGTESPQMPEAPAAGSGSGPASPSGSDAANDVLKRLMDRRKKELGQ